MVGEAFELLHQEGGQVFNLSVHPWLMGMAHRIKYLDEGSRSILHVEPHEFLDGSKGFRVNGPRGDQVFDTLEEAQGFIAKQGPLRTPTYNYVGTDPFRLDILAKYGITGAAAVPPTLGAFTDQSTYQEAR